MSQTKRIVIEADKPDPIPVKLVGTEYLANIPSGKLALNLAEMSEAAGNDVEKLIPILDTLVVAIFGKKQAKLVQARLKDLSDDLDYTHLMTLIEKLVEQVAPDPTM